MNPVLLGHELTALITTRPPTRPCSYIISFTFTAFGETSHIKPTTTATKKNYYYPWRRNRYPFTLETSNEDTKLFTALLGKTLKGRHEKSPNKESPNEENPNEKSPISPKLEKYGLECS